MLGRNPQRLVHAKTATKAAAFSLAVFAFFSLAATAFAQAATNDQFGVGAGAAIGLTATDPRILIARIIQVGLGVLGMIAVVLVVYAGFLWMTAGGEAEKVDRAKKILTQAIIGLLIIASSFAIATFVLNTLTNATTGGGINTGDNGGGSGACIGLSASCPSGALGSGIVDSNYPARGATGVPRNTRVIVTFKEKIDPASVVIGGAAPTVAIIKSSAVVGSSNQFEAKYAAAVPATDIDLAATPDGRTFAFVQKNCSGATPDGCFGSPSEDVFYTVVLRGGATGIKKANGSAAFTGTFASGYLWEFQVSTVLDLTPPTVTAAYPVPDSTDNPRNTLIHLDFSEAIDPISVQQISVTNAGNVVAGSVLVGAGYTSAEFRTDAACGVNSCGETIYCLPGSATINTLARADGLTSTPPTGVFPPNGLTDMSGNSLDGDADGKAEGPGKDDYAFKFGTNNEIDLVPPKISAQEPASQVGSIARDLNVTATFSKLMSTSSVTTDSVRLVPAGGAPPINYWILATNISSAAGAPATQTKVTLRHDLLDVNQPYAAEFGSQLRDLHQNCFFPSGGQTSCTGNEKYCCNGVPTNSASEYKSRCGISP